VIFIGWFPLYDSRAGSTHLRFGPWQPPSRTDRHNVLLLATTGLCRRKTRHKNDESCKTRHSKIAGAAA
jgi:hypothetical protein